MDTLVVIGPGELGRLIAGGALRCGRAVVPVRRQDEVADRLRGVPAQSPVLVATGEAAMPSVVAALPPERRADVILVQNELFPAVWEEAGLSSPTVAIIWLSKKPGRPIEVARPSEVYGPHAAFLVDALSALDLPATVLSDEEALGEALVAKFAFILTINALGLERDVTVGEWLRTDEARARAALGDAIRLGAAHLGRSREELDEGAVAARALEAMQALGEYPAKGRTAAARLQRARADAARLAVELSALAE